MSGPESASEYVGRVFGERVMEIRFRAPCCEELQVGEMLVVEDDAASSKYLVRVMDIEHGADMESPDWMQREAGELIIKDFDEEAVDLVGLSSSLYKVGVSSPLGHIQGKEFKKTKSIPTHFSKVRRPIDEDYDFLQAYLGDIEVGRLRSGDKVLGRPVGFWGRAMPYHIGIFATTGMGKSNLMKNLALSCMRLRRYGFLILDPHGEYYDGGEAGKKGLRHAQASQALEVFSSRKLDGPYNPLRISATEIEIDDLANLYEFTPAQLECLQAAQWRYGANYLLELHAKDAQAVSQDLSGRFHEGSINVIKRRLENIFRFELITKDKQFSITNQVISCLHAGKVVLVDTSNMFEAEELLVSTVLARAIFERNKSFYADKGKFDSLPPLLIAMEEAQRVLSQSKGTIFAQIAREGRKFKVGLCAVSQQPKLINEEVVSQFNTLFILGLADKRDRDILRNSAKQDISMLDNEIQMLMPGEALVASPFTPFAVPVKIHLFEEYLARMNSEACEEEGKEPRKVRTDSKFF
ncbi:MAG: ATP-binding protein [Methanomassiliicoccales archaeon]|nr:ATP-binding protein [Methanomassiliicoccales archaeon]